MESNVLNLSIVKTDIEYENEQIAKMMSDVCEQDLICEQKLSTMHHLENIKRHSMSKLLEEVLSVQRLTKKLKTLQKQAAKSNKTNHNLNISASDSEDDQSGSEDIEQLTEEINHVDSNEQQNLYNLLKSFITPTATVMSSELLETIKSAQQTGSGASKKRRRSSSSQNSTTPRTRVESKRPQLAEDDGISPSIVIGPMGTKLSRSAWNTINWTLTGPAITRKILMEVFDRDTLAFHTLTGKPSPAFTEFVMPKKQQLNPDKVSDIIYFMTTYFEMTAREVRSAITTKCADENKMHRQREQKKYKK